MQIDKKQYNPALHDVFKGLTVKQPYADLLTRPVFIDESGGYHAEKSIEVRSRNINYRGDLLICSSLKPIEHPLLMGNLCGVTCGLVELYDTKPVEEFTPEDWDATCIPEKDRPRKGWGWLMRNPRRVIEMPVKGQLGLYDIIVPKDDITEYPRAITIDAAGWEIIKKRIGK